MDLDDFPFRFKSGSRAIFFDGYSVIGDLHIGFEDEINKNGYNIWDKTEELTNSIISLKTKKLILLGDIRKEYTYIKGKEEGILIKFFSQLSNAFQEIILTKGNHDGGIERITSKFNNIIVKKEFIHKKVGFMHGHSLPSKKFAENANTLCMGHLHPFIFIKDSNGMSYREDCFFFTKISLPEDKFPNSRLKNGIVLPKFNPYIGGSDEFEEKSLMKYLKVEARMTANLLIVR